MNILNTLFSDFQWYRRFRGGKWYLIELPDYYFGGFFVWKQDLSILEIADSWVAEIEEY